MNNIILHCDLNCFYASCEMIDKPYLRNLPMCVGGDKERRHGIVLAKNNIAKSMGIKTAETLYESFRKCPNLIVVPPNYQKYLNYSNQVKNIFKRYSDKIQSFGIDEAWIDVTSSIKYFGSLENITNSILNDVYKELGLTLSIGISDNKTYAKLGSDLAGMQEVVIIKSIEDIKNLPVKDLLMVGSKTNEKLEMLGIHNIGQLAKKTPAFLVEHFGKNGNNLYFLANGIDLTPVKDIKEIYIPKSIGNSTTTYRDLESIEDVKVIFSILSDSIAQKLKNHKLYFKTIQISIRDNKLKSQIFQKTLKENSDISHDIYINALNLFKKYDFQKNIRSLGIAVSKLSNQKESFQFDIFDDFNDYYQKEKALDKAIEKIKTNYGYNKIFKANAFLDKKLSNFNPEKDNIISFKIDRINK